MTCAQASDVFTAALCVWREMRGESDEARLACFWVIKNRALDMHARWPQTWYGVVTQKYQFSSFNVGDPNASLMPREGTPDWQAWVEIQGIIDEPGPDPTDGANQYEALPPEANKPGWVHSARLVKQIGKTRFYKL